MVVENKNCVELAKKFIGEHNNNSNWSPFDRIEMTAIIMFAEWLESNRLSLEKKEIFNNGNISKLEKSEIREDVILELLDSGDSFMSSIDQYREILIKGPGNFVMMFSISLRPKDSKFPNFSVGNINIYLPSKIFDKIVYMLGEEYRKNIKKDVTDVCILKIDDHITFSKNEDRS